eukprot:gene13772-29287_t
MLRNDLRNINVDKKNPRLFNSNNTTATATATSSTGLNSPFKSPYKTQRFQNIGREEYNNSNSNNNYNNMNNNNHDTNGNTITDDVHLKRSPVLQLLGKGFYVEDPDDIDGNGNRSGRRGGSGFVHSRNNPSLSLSSPSPRKRSQAIEEIWDKFLEESPINNKKNRPKSATTTTNVSGSNSPMKSPSGYRRGAMPFSRRGSGNDGDGGKCGAGVTDAYGRVEVVLGAFNILDHSIYIDIIRLFGSKRRLNDIYITSYNSKSPSFGITNTTKLESKIQQDFRKLFQVKSSSTSTSPPMPSIEKFYRMNTAQTEKIVMNKLDIRDNPAKLFGKIFTSSEIKKRVIFLIDNGRNMIDNIWMEIMKMAAEVGTCADAVILLTSGPPTDEFVMAALDLSLTLGKDRKSCCGRLVTPIHIVGVDIPTNNDLRMISARSGGVFIDLKLSDELAAEELRKAQRRLFEAQKLSKKNFSQLSEYQKRLLQQIYGNKSSMPDSWKILIDVVFGDSEYEFEFLDEYLKK